MKKIININLSGRVIPIEDSAYEKLQAYIESLRRYFSHEEGRDEIINDIESRIAELMNEKIRKGNEAITDADIEEIIASMGRVEDFEENEKEEYVAGESAAPKENTYNYYTREKGRLYRDRSDKIIGGVCSGIANYLNIDPAVIRILFAIICFGGGFGFLAYIILWIILPARDLEDYGGKRLYRNPEDRIIGGVAGGLAAYFGKSASVIRLIFAAPLLLNILFGIFSWPFFHEGSFVPNILFGSFTGTFIFAYIVLWIVLPEANSEYQKMEMRGEKVDVNRIRQNVKEGMENMKGRMKEWGSEVKSSAETLGSKAREFSNTRGRAFAAEAGAAARRTGRGVGHVIGVLFKAFFLFIAGTIAFALFVALLGVMIGGVSVWPLKDFLLDGFWQNAFGWGTLILFLGVPLLGFIVWLLRRIMKVRSQHSYLGWTFGGLWALGWICAAMFAASLVNDFRMSNFRHQPQELSITQPVNDKMIVKVSEPELQYSGTFPWLDIDGEGFDITHDTLRTANIRIENVMLSTDSNYHVEIKKYSRGRNVFDAEEKANKIQFRASYTDSILDLGSSIAIDRDSKFRGQQVIVLIRVPAGKKIRFDETIDKLHTFNINFNDHDRRRREWDTYDWSFGYKMNVDYTMGTDGQLKDPTGIAPSTGNKDYRYQPSDSLPKNEKDQQILKEIEEEKKRLEQRNREKEESERRIQQLEEQRKSTIIFPGKIKKTNKADGAFAGGPSPVSSMSQWF